jgi:hypothetical protein
LFLIYVFLDLFFSDDNGEKKKPDPPPPPIQPIETPVGDGSGE